MSVEMYRLYPFADLMSSSAPQSFQVTKYPDTRMRGSNGAMIKDESGRIYYTGRRRDVRDEVTEVRRAFCRLSGMRNSDLDAAVKLYKEDEARKSREENYQWISREAEKIGYLLIEDPSFSKVNESHE